MTTTPPKIATTRTGELVCPCGNRLSVTVPAVGWLMSLLALSLANHWKLAAGYDTPWSDEMPAFCPKCHD